MKKNLTEKVERVYEVVKVEVLLGRHSEPSLLGEYLSEHGFEVVGVTDGKLLAKASKFVFCSHTPKDSMHGDFEMFCVFADHKRERITKGQSWYAGPAAFESDIEGTFEEYFLIMVRGDRKYDNDAMIQYNVHTRPLSEQGAAFIKKVEKEVDFSDKISVIRSCIHSRNTNPLEVARLIEEVLAEHAQTEYHDRSGKVVDLAHALGISTTTLNKTRATLSLHPSLHEFLKPGLSTKSKMTLDCVGYLVRVEASKQVELWNEVSNEKTSTRKQKRIRELVTEK